MMKWCGGLLLVLCAASVCAEAIKPQYWSFWDRSAENNHQRIDQGEWNSVLQT